MVGGALIEIAKSGKTETAGKARGELIGGLWLAKAGERIGVRAGKKRQTLVGFAYDVDAAKEIFFNAGVEQRLDLGMGTFTADEKLHLKVGENEVVLTEGVLRIKSKTTITIKTSGANNQSVTKAEQNP